ncbi:hypothetical protein ACFFSW_17840 [Saccharothrix longispora]|uniref:Uncharacterized protein n=1 Tax=Saccharothrix longispora TaxID=33920 RepID=A0ABU1PSJ3_9PSEU|nr:hypothetical protein [Saccharothrix longispora]MDR6593561.1 hypothetical protein [Saccharothrix longispora]
MDGPLSAIALVTAGVIYRLVNYTLVVGAVIGSNPISSRARRWGRRRIDC